MSKREIIKNSYPFYDPNQHKDVELCGEQVEQLMDEYAEKVAVAFAEWAEDEGYQFDKIDRLWSRMLDVDRIEEISSTDLYQYFITNVYNK